MLKDGKKRGKWGINNKKREMNLRKPKGWMLKREKRTKKKIQKKRSGGI